MLKYGFNLIARSRCFHLLRESENFKILCIKNGVRSYTKDFNQMKDHTFFKSGLFSFQSNKFSYKKPVVLISGILSFFGFPEEPELIMKIKQGILLIQRGQYEDAEVMLHLALQLAQEEKDEDGITFVNDTLANLAFETGNYEKAEKLFVNVLQRLILKGEQEDSIKVIHISLKLAKIFQEGKEFKKAEQGFNFCADALEKKLEEGDEDTLALWGMCMDWYARFLLDVGRKDEALTCFKKAYEMCVKVNGEEHEQSVVLLNDLGTVSNLVGDTETAMNYFEAARDIGKKLPGMKDLAVVYVNLGQLYLLKEMYKESRIACEEGYKLANSLNDEVGASEAKQCLENIKKVFKSSDKVKELKQIDLDDKGFKKAEFVKG